MISMSDTPRHCANNVICSVGVRHDGVNLLEVCFMPVNSLYEKSKHANMFTCKMRPAYPVDLPKSRLRKEQLRDYQDSQIDTVNSVDMFLYWLNQVRPKGKQLMPLCWNWSITGPIIEQWLGYTLYKEVFHPTTRDMSSVWNWLLDRHDSWGEPKLQTDDAEESRFFEGQLISLEDDHNTLERTKCMIQAYKQTLRSHVPFYR